MRAGDRAPVERPTYTGPLRVLKVAGVQPITIGVDAEGLMVDELAARLYELKRRGEPGPRAIYVVPTFANPSGATMPVQRRLRLLQLAVEHQFVIIEDDPYGQLRFPGRRYRMSYRWLIRCPGRVTGSSIWAAFPRSSRPDCVLAG